MQESVYAITIIIYPGIVSKIWELRYAKEYNKSSNSSDFDKTVR